VALFTISTPEPIRIDDRLSTLGNTSLIEVLVPSAPIAPVRTSLYGTVLIGITGTLSRQATLVMRVKKVYDFGIFLQISELFPQGLPSGFEGLLWDCWYVPRRTGYDLEVLGVQP
jgi:hypothetical protein